MRELATETQRHRGTEMEEPNKLTEAIIGCAIEVHRELGPRLLESTYEAALCAELDEAGLKYQRQSVWPVVYRGKTIGEYRTDLIVEDAVVVEVKSVERHDLVFAGLSLCLCVSVANL
ncbi:MAG TPA: GxxExxY protein [Bryobacterales bacterium]|nr:GxxExxY protein [Bryobacterales bacterium]